MNIEGQHFSQLIKRHKTTIYSVCLMFASCQDEANDLMQEVLIKLWSGRSSFKEHGDERGWVWRVAMNTCITQDKRRKRRKKIQVPIDSNLLTADTPDSRQMQQLHERIRSLAPFDRAIVLLWLEDLSYEKIGKIVGTSAKNISVRLVRIKEQLKKM